MNLTDLAVICKALSDPNRLQIMQMLSEGEKCGCKLLEAFDITQPTLSHDMKILCDCGIVKSRKEGKWHHYSMNTEMWNTFSHYLKEIGERSLSEQR